MSAGYELFAEDLRIKDVGRTVRSLVYRDKNKTSKPSGVRTYTIDSIYVHKNGNILINSMIYLRANTIVEFVNDKKSN